jgi:hypothetical protein
MSQSVKEAAEAVASYRMSLVIRSLDGASGEVQGHFLRAVSSAWQDK